jgi:hypothetical protein
MSISDCPALGPARDEWILNAVKNTCYFNCVKLTIEENGNTGVFNVFQDALKVMGVRVNVSASLQQKIADELGFSLLTAKIADAMWINKSIHLNPYIRGTLNMSSIDAMVEHSDMIESDLAIYDNIMGIISTVGKHWLLDNDLIGSKTKAMNYGWHFKGPIFKGISGSAIASGMKDYEGNACRLIQGRGSAHDINHVDYSQTCVLVNRDCEINGVNMDIRDVFSDPVLCNLVSHQGKLKFFAYS